MRADQLLGHDFATAQAFGLARDWAAKVIAATGNYGEIFERTTGEPFIWTEASTPSGRRAASWRRCQ